MYKDEPSWVVDQLLRRKRDDLKRQWDDREKRLESARVKEKALEQRARKRIRLETSASTKPEDEDAEWLLDDPEDRESDTQDALSGLSKESREVLQRLGLGGPLKKEEDTSILEEDVKVRPSPMHRPAEIVTVLDLLYVKNALATVPIHHRAAPPRVPIVVAQRPRRRAGLSGGGEAAAALFATEALHQPYSLPTRIRTGHQRPLL